VSSRALVALFVLIGGLAALPVVVPYPAWTVVPWLVIGAIGGVIAGRASLVWLAWLAALVGVPLILALGEVGLYGQMLVVGVPFAIALVAILTTTGFIPASVLVTRRRTLGLLREDWRAVPRRWRLLLATSITLVLIAVTGFSLYIGANGATAWVEGGVNTDCRTPAVLGWAYEAINYDQNDDATLSWQQKTNPDGTLFWDCPSQGAAAGDEVVTSDGVPIAGWYIPAATNPDPAGPTIVIIPGAKSNKSAMLEYAKPVHDQFNVLLLDDRGMGRSRPGTFSLGLHEHLDVEAMVGWLEQNKHPRWIAALGDSLGAQTALATAVGDGRVKALVLDSMHAEATFAAGNIMETEYGLPPLPGALAIVGFASLDLGGDVASVDPLATITRLRSMPVLLIHGTDDRIDVPAFSVQLVVDAAKSAGLPVELHWCQGGTHGALVTECAADWTRWTNDFLQRAAAASSSN
jgi:pimeloyl-ACP methyl ester carboxylesterase